jgi:AcrR family transcriptional regulator
MNNTNDMIRYVAFKLFLEKGYEATNIRDICKEVDIKASSLYFYYKSKQELFFSIYDEIYCENIRFRRDVEELNQNIFPNLKLYYLYKRMMGHFAQDIVKQKFLLRYHLFPPEELSASIREKYKDFTGEENKVILNIVNQCLDRKILNDNRLPNDYLQEYKKFESSQVTEMIISNIKVSDTELDTVWIRFWNSTMLNL